MPGSTCVAMRARRAGRRTLHCAMEIVSRTRFTGGRSHSHTRRPQGSCAAAARLRLSLCGADAGLAAGLQVSHGGPLMSMVIRRVPSGVYAWDGSVSPWAHLQSPAAIAAG